jgi:hypothetical protein
MSEIEKNAAYICSVKSGMCNILKEYESSGEIKLPCGNRPKEKHLQIILSLLKLPLGERVHNFYQKFNRTVSKEQLYMKC